MAAHSIVDMVKDPALFQPWFRGSSWDGWIAILKGAYALPMSDDERAFFRSVANREPPTRRVRELWVAAGRRAGKDSIASVIAAASASLFEPADKLRPGERALCLCLACDRDQAKIVLNYARSFFMDIPLLKTMVTRETKDGFELDNAVEVAVATNSFRSVRGRPILCAVLDECAFYRDDSCASPDEEVDRAITPGMSTIPEAMLIGISSPYRRAGLLYRKYRDHFGKDSDDVLVIQAPSMLLNPTLDQAIIDRALEEDPAAAKAEWLAEFRTDIETFVAREVVEACVEPGCHERPPLSRGIDGNPVDYIAFVDPAGGSGTDSMTLAITHREDKTAVLDCIREVRPPFSPQQVVDEFATVLKLYHVWKVEGDRWGGEFVREQFRRVGIQYELSDKPKSDIYKETLSLLNSKRVELLDHPKLISQFCSLERRTARGGRDSIDHPPSPSSHDDVCNAAAGALLKASGIEGGFDVDQFIRAYGDGGGFDGLMHRLSLGR